MQTLTRSRDGRAVDLENRPARLYLRLVFTEAAGPPRPDTVWPVPVGQGLVLGRAPEAGGDVALALPDDGWASRTHARVSRLEDGDALRVDDLGSRNGTYVDGQRVAGAAHLAENQVLQVGSALFVVGGEDDDEDHLKPPPVDFACRGPLMRALWRRVLRLAHSDVSVLLLGEMGTGKTRLARLIHENGARARAPFVHHNCSALPRNLEEATLFGVVANFIPQVKAQEGLVTRAGRGTLFLDELADLPEPAQAKLLDAFDPTEPSYVAVGGAQRLETRCRLISATNRDVFRLARRGVLRQDLLSRLVVGQIEVPPLRARREDLLFLFDAALRRAGHPGVAAAVRTVEAASALLLAQWVENVRGLESLAQRVALGERLTPEMVRTHADRGIGDATVPEIPAVRATPSGPVAAVAAPSAPPPPGIAPTGPPPVGPAIDTPAWPPSPAELLDLLAKHNWEIKAAAESIDRRRETLSRLVKSTFGGREEMNKAWRVYQASGRAPDAATVDHVHTLFFDRAGDPAVEAARNLWRTRGQA